MSRRRSSSTRSKPATSWDVLESYEDSIAAIYYSREWDAKVVLGLDRRFIFSLTDAAFGGDGSMPPFESDRPFTSLECRLARSVFNIVIPEFEDLLQPITSVTFDFEKLETKLDFQILGQTDIPVVVIQILFQILDNGGRMFMIIPQSALYPIRKLLERSRALEGHHVDPDWAKRMQDGIASANMVLHGTLEAPDNDARCHRRPGAGSDHPPRSRHSRASSLSNVRTSVSSCASWRNRRSTSRSWSSSRSTSTRNS